MRQAGVPDPSDVFKTGAHWRMRGEELRTIADDASDPAARAMMPLIAADYDRLARHVDDRASDDIERLGQPHIGALDLKP